MKQICNKIFTRMIIISICIFLAKFGEVSCACTFLSFVLSEAELPIHLIH